MKPQGTIARTIARMMSALRAMGHGEYREMCSLAALGQLGGPQMSELNEHVASCESCRNFLESVAQASVAVMPALAEGRIGETVGAPPAGMRARFLARLEKETTHGDRAAVASFPFPRGESFEVPIRHSMAREVGAPTKSRRFAIVSGVMAALAGCAVIAAGAFYLGERKVLHVAPAMTVAQTGNSVDGTNNPALGEAERLRQLEAERNALRSQLVEVKDKLSHSTAEQAALQNDLDATRKELETAKAEAQSVALGASQASQSSELRVSKLQNDLNQLTQRLGESEFKLAAEKKNAEDLRGKLELTEANLQQELNVKGSASEIGSLVAARNLHIVDVYDADPSGKQHRSFGRVLYVEGKSLVFYAYDLDDHKQFKTNVVFYVWGGKTGVKEVTHNLGILRKDDDGQGRWAMTFDDSKVLSEINSVFVTAEAPSKHYDQPRGRKVLYAYFGGPPNHP